MAGSIADSGVATDSIPQEGQFEITVLNLSGRPLLVVCLEQNSTVMELKQLLAIQTGHLVEVQQLSYGKLALNDDMKLKDCGLEGKVVITLMLKSLDVDLHIETLRAKGSMREADDIKILCALMKCIFLKEPSLLELEPPLVMGGHLMGCAEQLNYILDTFGEPPASQYLFLGNYVGRGRRCIDTLTLLLLYKKKHPKRIHLLRGKHESGSISRIYGFYDECKRNFSIRLWKCFIEVFNSMPFCALIRDCILCVPSGLSPELRSIDDLRKIERPVDIPDHGLLCDLCWSYYDDDVKGWREPDKALELLFGLDVLEEFLRHNRLERICCSQHVTENGWESSGDRLLQVFSASNYCGDFHNQGAVILLDENLEHGEGEFLFAKKEYLGCQKHSSSKS